jgi:ABC-type multidrug transport system fused ATPase/permease subunit
MSGGEIIDAGSHEELYKSVRLYKEIVEKYNI